MIPSDPALLDTLADCLESGDTLVEALDKVATAGAAAGQWTRQVRRSARPDVGVARALREANVVDDDELSILSADNTAALGSALRAVVDRRRRRLARQSALRWGLAGPFALAVLTVAFGALADVVTGGPVVWPMLCGLVVLALTAGMIAGLPALLRRPQALRLCTQVPGIRSLAALHAEEELTIALAPFADGGALGSAGLAAGAALVAWSPLGETLRDASRSVPSSAAPLPMGGLDSLAGQLSPETGLAIVGGVASKRLRERLAARGDAIALRLTARLRLATRALAYSILVLFSVISLVGMIARGLPGMLQLPGGATSPDQKELEDLLKQLQK